MQGYGDVRQAARAAIERAGCEPILADDFSASTTSPRTACLDSVASSDAIVLRLGKQYVSRTGGVVASGLSATHEEYQEAVRRKKQILAFLDSRDNDPTDFRRMCQESDGAW